MVRPGRITDLDQILDLIEPGMEILLHSACAEPQSLVEGLISRAREGQPNLRDLVLITLAYRGASVAPPAYADVEMLGATGMRVKTLFTVPSLRKAQSAGFVDYLPSNFASLPQLLRKGFLKPDFAFLQVGFPDKAGCCSFGPSAALVPAILELGIPIIAEMNRRMPSIDGPKASVEHFAAILETDRPLIEAAPALPGEIENAIAANVMEFIQDGANVQLGVGGVSEAILKRLPDRKNLGLVGSAILDGAVDLIRSGAVTNATNPNGIGKTVGSLLLGSKRLFDFAADNPLIELTGIDKCNSPLAVAAIPNFVSVNSAFQVDHWGQVNAEMIGEDQLAGAGSQVDYAMGAWCGDDAVSVIALPSRTASGRPRIVPRLTNEVVTMPRHVAQIIVTEHGAADLRGRTLSERARLLQSIA
jgi:4-hydroxybutyrate CoA-transferase